MDVAYKMMPLPTQQEHGMLSADDDDNMSANSQNSHCQDSLTSNVGLGLRNEPSEGIISEPTISVRDMIKRYDIVAQQNSPQATAPALAAPLKRHSSHHTLYAPKAPLANTTNLNAISKFGSQTNVRQLVTQVNDGDRFAKLSKELRPNWVKKNSSGVVIEPEFGTGTSSEGGAYGSGGTGFCGTGIANNTVKFSSSGMALGVSSMMNTTGSGMALSGSYVGSSGNNSAYALGNPNVSAPNMTTAGSATNIDHLNYAHRSRRGRAVQNDVKEFGNTLRTGTPYNRSRMQSPDFSEDVQQPPQTSYQSRTTISKTSNGVRITIDIFFDQDNPNVNPLDMVGSRIETEIPHSRILNEFQEQSSALSERF